VRGIQLSGDDVVVGMVVVHPESTLLVVSEKGMGKRTEVDAYRLQKRGGKGVINLRTSDKTGEVVSIKAVALDEQLMLITRKGVVNRQRVDEIRVIGRATQGVRLMNLDEGDAVVDVARVVVEDEAHEAGDEAIEAIEAIEAGEAGEAGEVIEAGEAIEAGDEAPEPGGGGDEAPEPGGGGDEAPEPGGGGDEA
jgi:DNA gyrase subunit A